MIKLKRNLPEKGITKADKKGERKIFLLTNYKLHIFNYQLTLGVKTV